MSAHHILDMAREVTAHNDKLQAESAAFIRASQNIADPLPAQRHVVYCCECECHFSRLIAKNFSNCMQHFAFAEVK